MKITYQKILAILAIFVTLVLPANGFISVQAETSAGSAGVIVPAGPVEPTGPQEKTGPAEPTGPQENSLVNIKTGPDSVNNNQTDNNQTLSSVQNRQSTINNNIGVDASSGENAISKNSSVDSLSSGNIDGAVNVINMTNSQLNPDSSVGIKTINNNAQGDIVLNPSEDRTPLDSLNSVTGPSSVNVNSANESNVVVAIDKNKSTIENQLNIEADTGNNAITQNTLIGKISTGSIDLAVNLINLADLINPNLVLNLDIWSIMNGYSGDLVIPNTVINKETGPDSNNNNESNINKTAKIDLTSQTDINNGISVDTKTGDNEISQNSYVGDITTGKNNVEATLLNIANDSIPVYYIINVFGKWTGLIPENLKNNVFVNQITGPSSANSNDLNQESDFSLTAEIDTSINNLINVKANTGQNRILKNTAVGRVTTGDINLLANVANITRSIGKNANRFRLEVVNIFGNWAGNVKTEADKPSQDDQTAISANQNNLTAPVLATASFQTTPILSRNVPNEAIEASKSSTTSNTLSEQEITSNTDSSTPSVLETNNLNTNNIVDRESKLSSISSNERNESASKQTQMQLAAILLGGSFAGFGLALRMRKLTK